MYFIKESPKIDLYTKDYYEDRNYNFKNPICLFYIGGIAGLEGPLATLIKNDKNEIAIIFTKDSSDLGHTKLHTIITETNIDTIKNSLTNNNVYEHFLKDGKHYYANLNRKYNLSGQVKTTFTQDYLTWDELVKTESIATDLTYTDMFNWALDEYNITNETSLNALFTDLENWVNTDPKTAEK